MTSHSLVMRIAYPRESTDCTDDDDYVRSGTGDEDSLMSDM